MINIVRPTQTPKSLESQEIKDYLDALQDHLDAPDIYPRPDKNLPAYRNSDLLEQFNQHFWKKCWLTEMKFAHSASMDVDHFVPKSDPKGWELRYAWDNLFPIHPTANSIRPRKFPEAGYLNPCDPNDDVETELLYAFECIGDIDRIEIGFKARDEGNAKAVETASLLDRIHTGKGVKDPNVVKEFHAALKYEYDLLLGHIIGWQKAKNEKDGQNELRYGNSIRKSLSRHSPFTMLLRSLTVVEANVPASFLD